MSILNSEQGPGSLHGLDGPTGLPTKAVFFDRLRQAVLKAERDGKTAAVLFLRIDRFKVINDAFGKEAGDAVLAEVARRFSAVLRQSDTLGRPGRDEFMVLLPEISRPEDASIVAHKLLDALRAPFAIDQRSLFININIGISIFPGDSHDPEELLRQAYTAKLGAVEDGRNVYRYYSREMNERAFRLLEMETQLRLALERDEFLLHYQPVFSLDSLAITAMEALIRWEHPDHGLIGPAHFINIAELSDTISHIGLWVMDAVCAQHRLWQAAGARGARVAINLSARQFSSRQLVDDIARRLDHHRMAPESLEIEVTESSLMHSLSDTEQKFRRLKELGVSLSLDDFGTGYSSLIYLKNLPFDRVKIDRSFVRHIGSEPRDAAIARAIIEMAHALGMKVTGEGVESEEQMRLLRAMGCDEVQGYLFSLPVAADCMGRLLAEPAAPVWSPGPARPGATP